MPARPQRPLRIGLIFDRSLDYCRGVMRGVKRFALTRPYWTFAVVAPTGPEMESLVRLRPAGFVAHVFSSHLAAALRRRKKPIVNVSSVLPRLRLPSVNIDNSAVGRLVA